MIWKAELMARNEIETSIQPLLLITSILWKRLNSFVT